MDDEQDERFKTHIKEPRWQQIASIVIVAAIILVWIYVFIHR